MPPPRKKTAMVKPSMEKLYGETYDTYTAKYGPQTAILMNVGSFYSMYDMIHVETGKSLRNVCEVAEACAGVPRIETREGEWNHVMWGFPEHSCGRYEQLLIQAGYTVVILGQDRDESARVLGRSLERVISPGTYIDATVTANVEERRVLSVLIEPYTTREGKPAWLMASTAFTVATGECISIEGTVHLTNSRPNLDAMEAFWSAQPPSELAVWTRGLPAQLLETQVRPWFAGNFRGPIHIYTAEPCSAAATRGSLQFLHRVYARDTALHVGTYLDVQNYPAAQESLTLLLRWIDDHNPSYLVNLRNHTMWEPADELILGNAALQQLGMLPIAKPNECLLHWLQRALTPMGRRALRERCVRPITDVDELEGRQDRIATWRAPAMAALKTHFYNMSDLHRIYRKFYMGTGDREALLGLLVTLRKTLALSAAMVAQGAPKAHALPAEAAAWAEQMLETWDAERIRACNTDQEWGVGPHHPWVRGRHADLDNHEDAWLAIQAEVAATTELWCELLGDGEDAVKVEWKREEGAFVWTTTKRRAVSLATLLKSRRKYELSYVSKASSSVAVLESAELTTLSRRARVVWDAWVAAAEKAWKAAWTLWEGNYAVVDWVADVDVTAALARCADEYGYVRPAYVVSEEAGLSVKDLRHPILERVHTATPYIAHSISLGLVPCVSSGAAVAVAAAAAATNGILLYGVNAAGKSSLSKAVGLAVLMAQIGMPVPATAMTLAPYNGLYTRILGNDNLWAGMSSFVVEMTELRTILNTGPRAMVLGDELCAGTETTSAIAIVGAGIRRLVDKGAHFIFATHLHELLEIPEVAKLDDVVKPYHLSVQAVEDVDGKGKALIYDRQLREGRGPAIYGLEVCRGLDMDPVFLEMATAMRRRWEGSAVDLAKASRYNAAVPVQVCDVCGSASTLETHHIVPQAAADHAGFVSQGRHKNDVGNLVILCDTCHDRHHRGEMEVKGWQATTKGRRLDLSQFRFKGAN